MVIGFGGTIGIGVEPSANLRLKIQGVGTTVTTASIYTTNSAATNTFFVDDAGNAYVAGDMSALTITDRTPYPKDLQTAIDAVNSMERLPAGEYEEGNKKKQVNHGKLHPYLKTSANERDLSATVSVHNEVIKELLKRVEALAARVEALEGK